MILTVVGTPQFLGKTPLYRLCAKTLFSSAELVWNHLGNLNAAQRTMQEKIKVKTDNHPWTWMENLIKTILTFFNIYSSSHFYLYPFSLLMYYRKQNN